MKFNGNVYFNIGYVRGILNSLLFQKKVNINSSCKINEAISILDIIYNQVLDIENKEKVEVPKCLFPDTSTMKELAKNLPPYKLYQDCQER